MVNENDFLSGMGCDVKADVMLGKRPKPYGMDACEEVLKAPTSTIRAERDVGECDEGSEPSYPEAWTSSGRANRGEAGELKRDVSSMSRPAKRLGEWSHR